jgi:hypothetical protein
MKTKDFVRVIGVNKDKLIFNRESRANIKIHLLKKLSQYIKFQMYYMF